MVFVFQKNVLYSPKASETRELLNNISRYNIHHVFIEPQFKNSNLEKMANYYTFDILTLDPI
jgi:ABC-type Zn2+ transport system substrate-binding protein/surface adhesin